MTTVKGGATGITEWLPNRHFLSGGVRGREPCTTPGTHATASQALQLSVAPVGFDGVPVAEVVLYK
jgi:hypothetical protein